MTKPDSKQPDAVEGEGSYTAARDYKKRTEDFVKSHDVEQAARDAAPQTPEQADELTEAEEKGRSRARQ